MKRYIATFTLLCALSLSASAQVSKQVEVTKDYAPEIGTVHKMDVTPESEVTIDVRPEIDYTITPRSFVSTLGTHRIKPTKVTYWQYSGDKKPCYLKLGAGYPLNTVGDFYAATHRADVGYIAGYANHYGQYSKLSYMNGIDGDKYKDNRSMQMNNKFGVVGGKYFGKYTLAGDVYYRMDTYHRYPLHNVYGEDGTPILEYKLRKIDFDDVCFNASFGDSFADYSHLNFKVYASADYCRDKSEQFVEGNRFQQINITAGAVLAREITKRSALSLDLDYKGYYGLKSLSAYENSIVGAKLLYRYRSGNLFDLNVGAKLFYDNNPADTQKKNRWHAFPVLNLSLNIGDHGYAVPYVEVDGELQNNSYCSLAKLNPYIAVLGEGNSLLQADRVVPNTELYNVRFGVSGHTKNSKFAYRFYANMSFMKNALYWYNVNQIFFDVVTANRNIWSLCGALDYRPISELMITAQVKGSLYNNYAKIGEETLGGAMPNVEAMLRVRYNHKKFTLGMSAELYGKTEWTCVQNESLFGVENPKPTSMGTFHAPTSLNLSLYADWHVNKTCTLFAEGNNLLGDIKALQTYNWAFYREMGASFTVGVKVLF